MSVSAYFVFGWILDAAPIQTWFLEKNIDLDDYLSDPDTFRDDIPASISLRRICPFPEASQADEKWSIHINYCTGKLSSFQTLPPFLLFSASEWVHRIQPTCGDPYCHAIIHYS